MLGGPLFKAGPGDNPTKPGRRRTGKNAASPEENRGVVSPGEGGADSREGRKQREPRI